MTNSVSLPTSSENQTHFVKTTSNSVLAAALRVALLGLFALVAALPPARAANANTPEYMTFQGYLTDGNGTALGNSAPKNYDVLFRIYDDPSAGTRLWAEQQTLTVDKGNFSVLLGEGSAVGSEPRPALSSLFADSTASHRFVEITVKGIGSGGSDSTILPRLRLLASPYAYLAQRSINAVNLINDTNRQVVSITGTNVGINKSSPAAALDVNGTARVSSHLTVNGFTNDGPSKLNGDVIVADKLTANRTYASTVNFNLDGSAYLTMKDTGNGVNPCINFDGGDWLEYVRANNALIFRIGSADKLLIKSSGVEVPSPNTISGFGTVPLGGIIMWSGSSVPSGWALCNGANGTPDLRGRFILGAHRTTSAGSGGRYTGETGGEETHTLTVPELPSHTHTTRFGNNGYPDGSGDRTHNYYIMHPDRTDDETAFASSATGDGAAHNNMPPYYVLAFIMRTQ